MLADDYRILNLTSKTIWVMGDNRDEPLMVIPPEDPPAHLAIYSEEFLEVNIVDPDQRVIKALPLVRLSKGKVKNLPKPEFGTLLIVPRIVAEELKRSRKDLLVLHYKQWEDKNKIAVKTLATLNYAIRKNPT